MIHFAYRVDWLPRQQFSHEMQSTKIYEVNVRELAYLITEST